MEDFSFGILVILLCNISSIKAQTNVALTSQGSTCQASQSECERAFDGVSLTSASFYRWSMFGEARGTWIKVTFNRKYIVYTTRFMQLGFAVENNFKDLQLTFEDGTQQQVTLTVRHDRFQWEEFTLSPPVETIFVDVLVLTAYTTGVTYNGFTEIEFYDGLLTTTTTVPTTATTPTTPSTTTTLLTTTTPTTTTQTTTPPAKTTPPTITSTTPPTTTSPIPTFAPTTTSTTNTTSAPTRSTTPSITTNATEMDNITPQETTWGTTAQTERFGNGEPQESGRIGVALGASLGSLCFLIILGGMAFIVYKLRKTSKELQKLKKMQEKPEESNTYYNVFNRQYHTEYEDITELQEDNYQRLQGDVVRTADASQNPYQELQVDV